MKDKTPFDRYPDYEPRCNLHKLGIADWFMYAAIVALIAGLIMLGYSSTVSADVVVDSTSGANSGSVSNSLSYGAGSSLVDVGASSRSGSVSSSRASGNSQTQTASAGASNGAASAGNSQTINFNSTTPNGTRNTTVYEQKGSTSSYNVVRQTGTTTIKNTPDTSLFIPGPTVSCDQAIGEAVRVPGLGVGLGGSYVDKKCSMREDARTLVSMGRPDAAVRRLCQDEDMAKALGTECPRPYVPTAQTRQSAPEAQQAAYQGPTYEEMVAQCRLRPDREYAACMRQARSAL